MALSCFKLPAFAAALLVTAGAFAAPGSAGPLEAIGKLTCKIAGNDAAIHFGSNREVTCRFRPYRRGRRERYVGRLKQYGVEVGVIGPITMKWTVLAENGRWRRGALAGNYIGVAAAAAVGVGGGANFLIGGAGRRMHLQPGALETRKGLNVAAGLTTLFLEPKRRRR